MKGYVYVVGNSSASKIGYSFNPKSRARDIANKYFPNSDFETYIGDISEESEKWETRCHEIADLFKISNEFFSIPFSKAVELVIRTRPNDSEHKSKVSLIGEITNENYDSAVSLINDCEKINLSGVVMGDLTSLWQAGNLMRAKEGKRDANLSKFLDSEKTKQFIRVCNDNGYQKAFSVTGVGNKKRTWACVHLMIYAAEYLSLEFHYQVIDAFCNGRIRDYSDGEKVIYRVADF